MQYDCPDIKSPLKLAHAYIPFQKLDEVFHPNEALCKGTLFPELYMPYKF